MCLILFAYRTAPGWPLVVAANRDEVPARSSDAVAFWPDHPQVIAGRDRVAGGTWLGATRNGRFAALTNFSQPDDPPAPRSRGFLVQEFLTGSDPAEHYAHAIAGHEYAGYNLLLFDGTDLAYTSNRGTTDLLEPGYYGLSNAELGARWPKCTGGAAALEQVLTTEADLPTRTEALLAELADAAVPPDDELPHRGRDLEFERRVAPRFLAGEEYGTRATSVLFLGETQMHFTEQSYGAGGKRQGRVDYEVALTG